MPEDYPSAFETVICVPGNWSDRSALLTAIATANIGSYLFAGQLLFDIRANEGYPLEIQERDEKMAPAFRYAGMVNRVPESFIDSINQHTIVLYLIGKTGSPEAAAGIAKAAQALLNAGGIGVKVETAGKAFTPEHWNTLVKNSGTADLYSMFVVDSITTADGSVHSCGMQNMGLADTIVSGLEFQESVDLISLFNRYRLIEAPFIKPGHTFSAAADAPVFKITAEVQQPYEGNGIFENPYGMWRLEHMP